MQDLYLNIKNIYIQSIKPVTKKPQLDNVKNSDRDKKHHEFVLKAATGQERGISAHYFHLEGRALRVNRSVAEFNERP